MVTSFKKRKYFIVIFVILFLIMTKFMKFAMWTNLPFVPKLRYLLLFVIAFFTFHKYKSIVSKHYLYNRRIVVYCISACLFTFLLRNIVYESGLGSGLELNVFMAFIFCTYFLFHYLYIYEKDVIIALTIVGLIAFSIQVFQQINPSLAFFSIVTESQREEFGISSDYIAGMRNGFYRFVPISQAIPVYLICYYFSKLMEKFRFVYLLLTLIFFASMYLMLTRMFIVCTGICCLYIYTTLNNVKRSRTSMLIVSLGIIITGVFYSDTLFYSLFSSDETGIEYSSQARMECAPFLLSKAISNPLLFIVGHGYPNVLWTWGNELGFWFSDIGVIGQIYIYGIVWFIVYLKLVYWGLVKMRKKIPCYIRAYILGMFCICYMMPSYGLDLELTLLWCILLYISDLYISKSDRVEHNTI